MRMARIYLISWNNLACADKSPAIQIITSSRFMNAPLFKGQIVFRPEPNDLPSVSKAYPKDLCNICTKLDQRRRRWADIVQMLYKCFVFAG